MSEAHLIDLSFVTSEHDRNISNQSSKLDVGPRSFVSHMAWQFSLFMIHISYLDSLNDVEIYSALQIYFLFFSFVINDSMEQFYCKKIQNSFK